jgi:energy-coupling factor transporter transmembrane protein EcfT
VSAVPATLVLASVTVLALTADRLATLGVLTAVLLAACLRAPASRRRPYVVGAVSSGVLVVVLSPFLWSGGGTLLWEGPTVPVLGILDVTTGELHQAALSGLRLVSVGLAFAVYTLFVDHDRLVGSIRVGRRSALAAALATRLVPTLERDAAGLREAVRGRGLELDGVRAYATLLSPLVSGSLERATNLSEAMEARGFGRPGATRAPYPAWTWLDRIAVAGAALLAAGAVLWL